jgi:hypothetical protein
LEDICSVMRMGLRENDGRMNSVERWEEGMQLLCSIALKILGCNPIARDCRLSSAMAH